MVSTSGYIEMTRGAGHPARARREVVLAALSLLFASSASLFAQADYRMSANYNPTDTSDTGSFSSNGDSPSSISFSRPVGSLLTIGPGKSYATSSGYADAGNLKLGVSGWAISRPGNGVFTDTRMSVDVWNKVTFLPGTSGLSLGDTTTVSLNVRVDGTLRTDARSWPASSWAHSDMGAYLNIVDSSIEIPSEGEVGGYSPEVAAFWAESSAEATDIYSPYYGYSYVSRWDESWGHQSNLVSRTTHDMAGEHRETSTNMYFAGAGHGLDTGSLNFSFQAVVGHTYDLSASMASYVNADHEAEAWADFDNTFAFSMTPGVNGVQSNWAIPGNTPTVPDSGGFSLMGIALLALAGLNRVRTLRRA